MKLMIMLLISLLLATDVEAAGSEKKCKMVFHHKALAKAEKLYGPFAGCGTYPTRRESPRQSSKP